METVAIVLGAMAVECDAAYHSGNSGKQPIRQLNIAEEKEWVICSLGRHRLHDRIRTRCWD